MIPLAPRAPYRAVEAASLSTVIDSISEGLRDDKSPSKGIPSTTYKGSIPALIDPTPLILTVAEEPGWPSALKICTPATLPESAFETFDICLISNRSESTTPADPVKVPLVEVPYATTITSSNNSVSVSRTILTL